MKKTLLPVLFALLVAAPGFAQVKDSGASPELEKKCTRITQAMAQELRLSELGYINLKALNCERMAKTEALVAAYGDNQNLLQEKMQEVELTYEQGITALLSPKQLEAYAVYRKKVSEEVFIARTEK